MIEQSPHRRFGGYEILSELGAGGMGAAMPGGPRGTQPGLVAQGPDGLRPATASP